MSDVMFREKFGDDRVGVIRKAKALGVSSEEITKQLVHAVKIDFLDPARALELADQERLFEV